jgi:hypothetical protein
MHLIKELKKYSFEPRKKGSPKNSGCVWELKDFLSPDCRNPIHLAKILKEGIHLMYKNKLKEEFWSLY